MHLRNRGRARMHARAGEGSEKERQNPIRPRSISAEPNAELELSNCEITTASRTLNRLHYPGDLPQDNIFIPFQSIHSYSPMCHIDAIVRGHIISPDLKPISAHLPSFSVPCAFLHESSFWGRLAGSFPGACNS